MCGGKAIADDGAVRLNEKGEDTLSIFMQWLPSAK